MQHHFKDLAKRTIKHLEERFPQDANVISKEIAQSSRRNSNLFEPIGELFELPARRAIYLLTLLACEDQAREKFN